ncbi:iron-siderophore ABC transporter substrate-binding protein [Cellulosimicrobium arenosum]|uniref:Iron-siderophore ABC transporter substrate-binding protein n=1 Tax=Cellulosimicrobium arenosum TaxID=2708133 RepID=A0A927IYD3_9MICO|nr:iron-siderophore ABC transporter substrate-binding protein [Cellulosimicrobium arenosum]MBD8077620.1 iron-siderophore ABC transporter substrate-binding protein [Cellulosimicrobium arenosum]
MRSSRPRPLATAGGALVALVATFALAACGTTEDPASGSTPDETTDAAASGPVTYTDERGEHTLDAPATSIVSLEWGLTENLVAIGADVAGQADVEGYNAWNTVAPIDSATPDVGTRGEPSLDAISALEPDLVVTTTDLPENVIAQIEEISPVLTLRGSDGEDPLGYMRSTVEALGEVTGRQDDAAAALEDFDAKVAEGTAALEDAGLDGAEFTMADGWVTNGTVSIRMYTPGSFFGAVGEEIGLTNAWTEGGDPDYGLAQTDVEGLTQLGDVQFVYIANDTDGGDPFVDGLEDNAVWEQLPFVEAGDVHRVPDGIWMFGGPLSGAAYVDALVDTLTA